MHTIRIHKNGTVKTAQAEYGMNLLSFLRDNSIIMDSPCGGKGKCGKCRIKVNGLKAGPSDAEKALLGEKLLKDGLRLACCNSIDADIDIYTADEEEKASIVTGGVRRDVKLAPVISKKYVELAIPDLDDQTADLERALMGICTDTEGIDIGILRKLPSLLRACDFKVTLVFCGSRLIGVEPGNTTGRIFGIAIDIGTTTIAAYLYDLNTGKCLDICSRLNPQRKFGADVISRIEYAMASDPAQDEMNAEITGCINQIIQHFSSRNKIEASEIYNAVFAGNTTMMHFLMNLDARNIAVSPFIPATAGLRQLPAGSLGIGINKNAPVQVFPCVSAYIGADTVAAVLSSGMYEHEGISLLVDIGTNGEVVLGNREWLYSCSTAAGPAFEGANIRNGVGGITGAIDAVELVPDFKFTTLGGQKPVGLCGSGIVDAIAQMLAAGIIDETGRLTASLPGSIYENRLIQLEGKAAFLIAAGGETADGSDIAITQKDVRELQNAKAAIAAGIKILAKRAGIRLEDIEKVYLAGGFGSKLNVKSALMIGLLPTELSDRIQSIGNAAGSGAIEGLLSADMLKTAVGLRERIKYVELSASADFTDEYVECMMFE